MHLVLVGLTAGWRTKCRWKCRFLKFPIGQSIRIFVRLISMQTYYSVRNAFQSALLKYNFFKVCFEARKIWLPCFFMSILTIKY